MRPITSAQTPEELALAALARDPLAEQAWAARRRELVDFLSQAALRLVPALEAVAGKPAALAAVNAGVWHLETRCQNMFAGLVARDRHGRRKRP